MEKEARKWADRGGGRGDLQILNFNGQDKAHIPVSKRSGKPIYICVPSQLRSVPQITSHHHHVSPPPPPNLDRRPPHKKKKVQGQLTVEGPEGAGGDGGAVELQALQLSESRPTQGRGRVLPQLLDVGHAQRL